MSYRTSSTSRSQPRYGEVGPVGPLSSDSWARPGMAAGGPRRQDNGGHARFGLVPKVILGLIVLMIAVRVLPVVLMMAARILPVVLFPLGMILVPVVVSVGLFWPVLLLGAIVWGVSRLGSAGRRTFAPRTEREALPGQPMDRPLYGESGERPMSANPWTSAARRVTPSDPALAAVLARGWELLDRSRRAIRQFPNMAVRQRAARIVDQGEQILDILREGQGDVVLATKFVERYLAPTTTILERYTRLANHQVASAQPALDHVVQHDLPLIERKFQEFYDRLHRGDLIDLEVASEMLEFELGRPDATTR